MQSSMLSGGSSHIRYGHYRYPRMLNVVCPGCLNKAALVHTKAPASFEHFSDTDFRENFWQFSCHSCLKETICDWTATKEYSLRFVVDVRGLTVWAWNENHFTYLISVFSGNELKDSPWATFKTYVPKTWLLKLKGKSAISKLNKLLQHD